MKNFKVLAGCSLVMAQMLTSCGNSANTAYMKEEAPSNNGKIGLSLTDISFPHKDNKNDLEKEESFQKLLSEKDSFCYTWGINGNNIIGENKVLNSARSIASEMALYESLAMPKGFAYGVNISEGDVLKFKRALERIPTLPYFVAACCNIEYEALPVQVANHPRLFSHMHFFNKFEELSKEVAKGKIVLTSNDGFMTLSAALEHMFQLANPERFVSNTRVAKDLESYAQKQRSISWDDFGYTFRDVYENYFNKVKKIIIPVSQNIITQKTPTTQELKNLLVEVFECFSEKAHTLLSVDRNKLNLFEESEKFLKNLRLYGENMSTSPLYKDTRILMLGLLENLNSKLKSLASEAQNAYEYNDNWTEWKG